MITQEVRIRLNEYHKLNQLYKNLVLQVEYIETVQHQVQFNSDDDQTSIVKAFGKTIELRFSMVIKNNTPEGQIKAVLVDTKNSKAFEKELLMVSFDTLGNITNSINLGAYGIEDDYALFNLVFLTLDALITQVLSSTEKKE